MNVIESLGFLAYWGLICLVGWEVVKFTWKSFLAHLLGFGVKWQAEKHDWAIITGATDGIGLEYAKQLAAKGYSLMLLARNEDKLARRRREILELYPSVEIKTVTVDFKRQDIYPLIAFKINQLHQEHSENRIDVLVNNVGVSWPHPEHFTMFPKEHMMNTINVNTLSCVKMMQIVLPRMLAHKRGIIINVSSAVGTFPVTLVGGYAASKAFVDYLTRALDVELADTGIVVQSLLAGSVSTQMTNWKKVHVFNPTPEDFVRGALKTVGIEVQTNGYWSHRFHGYLFDVIFNTFFFSSFSTHFVHHIIKTWRTDAYKAGGIVDTWDT